MKFFTLLLVSVSLTLASFAQHPVNHAQRVLFIGNSYTYVNGLPSLVADIASSMGDTLIVDSNTIGGYTLQQHAANATSLAKIMQGNWDYVVLQEQSQLPSFPIDQVDTGVLPYAHYLDSFNHAYNACGRSMFYMTWGYKNGDTSNCPAWPPVCTYTGMDSILRLRYMMMADSNNAVLSPVSAVRRYLRLNYPALELYWADESHPTPAGSYAAACCFYVALFRKDPELVTYNYSLSATDAAHIRTAAKIVAYDSMQYWHIGQYDPAAHFTYTTAAGNQVTFTNSSANATTYTWHFGDGDTSSAANPLHTYTTPGTYAVMLVAHHCHMTDTVQQDISTWPAGLPGTAGSNKNFTVNPNPAGNYLNISSPMFMNNNYRVTILNAMGQVVQSSAATGTAEHTIDVSVLPAGFYLLNISGNGEVVYRDIFVKK